MYDDPVLLDYMLRYIINTLNTLNTSHHITAHYRAFLNESVCIMQGFRLQIQAFLDENKDFRCSNTTILFFLNNYSQCTV